MPTEAVPFKVADLSLAEFGRREIRLAEHEMPGLMAVRASTPRPSRCAAPRITGSLHMTIQTAVLIETLVALGAQVRWASCNIFSTQDHAAAAVAVGPDGTPGGPEGHPGVRLEGRDAGGVLVVHRAGAHLAGAAGPNMILDDGGDATLLVHKGAEFEAAGAVPAAADDDPEEWQVILSVLRALAGRDPGKWTATAAEIKGVTEETTTGVHRLYEMAKAGTLQVPGHQRQRLGDQVEVRQQVRLPALAGRRHQPGHRRADRRQGRGGVRLRRRRQGLRGVAARPGRPGDRHRDRPDLRAAGGDGRLPGRARWRTSSAPPTSSSPRPATSTSSPPST